MSMLTWFEGIPCLWNKLVEEVQLLKYVEVTIVIVENYTRSMMFYNVS
jgi:hypothetical protein